MSANGNKVPLVLLAPRVTDDSVRIWKAAIDEDWSVQRLSSWRAPAELIGAGHEFLIYAEPLFAEAVADQLDLILLEPPPSWLPSLPRNLRQREIRLHSFAEARQLQGPVFVKPAEGKVFDARVYAAGSELPTFEQVDESLSVIVSEPVAWQLEIRCFVLYGQVLSMSPYWRNGLLASALDGTWPFLPGEEAQAAAFAHQVLTSGPMPPAFVLDIGVIEGQGWAVVEANPCWGAGLYGCQPRDALFTARHAIRHRRAVTDDDSHWVSPRVQKRLA